MLERRGMVLGRFGIGEISVDSRVESAGMGKSVVVITGEMGR